MTTLQIRIFALITLSALALAPVAASAEGDWGQGNSGGEHGSASTTQTREHQGATSTDMEEGSGHDATSSDEEASSTGSHAGRGWQSASSTATTTHSRGEGESGDNNANGEAHRSDVANIVHQLLSVAGEDKGIGEEVRAVASEQASSSLDASQAIVALDGESGWKVFLLGPDWKSIGDLRSTIETTDNSISRLEKAKSRATSSTTQATLDTQIAALKGVASSTQDYIDAHSSGFSLFGWLTRLVSGD